MGQTHRHQQTGVYRVFETRLDAQSADAKVTIDIHLNFSEQGARFQRARTE